VWHSPDSEATHICQDKWRGLEKDDSGQGLAGSDVPEKPTPFVFASFAAFLCELWG